MVKITPNNQNNLKKTSSADCFQVRSLSDERFVKKIGEIDSDTLDQIKEGLAKVLSIW